MNKIRVIDLLNKIANGEEVPERIKYVNREWFWCESCKIYEQLPKEGNRSNLYRYFADNGDLNDEVEIVEEEKLDPIDIDEFLKVRKTKKMLFIVEKLNEIIKRL